MAHCFWCEKDQDEVTSDHIVPRLLGGTLDFSVPSCEACQALLSKAEHEVGRKSLISVHALASKVKPRHPSRPTSGVFKGSPWLVKNALGGYGESLLFAGEQMRSLAHFEIKVVPGEQIEGRVRGSSPIEAQHLLDLFRNALKVKVNPGEPVCEITADLSLDPETAADPDFWPRIVLLPGDRLLLRGRNPNELMRFANVFTQIALGNYQINASAWNSQVQIEAGTLHKVTYNYDPQCERRIAAKIAYALARTVGKRRPDPAYDERLRMYILGLEDDPDELVSIVPDNTTFTTSSEPHRILLSPGSDPTAAFVSLYDHFDFRVELGSAVALPEPIIVFCEIDGSGMRIGSSVEAATFGEKIKALTFSRPWLEYDTPS